MGFRLVAVLQVGSVDSLEERPPVVCRRECSHALAVRTSVGEPGLDVGGTLAVCLIGNSDNDDREFVCIAQVVGGRIALYSLVFLRAEPLGSGSTTCRSTADRKWARSPPFSVCALVDL